MESKGFTHLHLHSQYSLLDGAISLDELLKRCKQLEMDAVAVTDHGNMFGAIARKLGVSSKFGRMVDPLADKILICGTFICFAIIGEPRFFGFGNGTLAAIHWSVAGIIILREAYVTALRHIAESRGVNFAATFSGKMKMFLQSFAIGTVIIKMAHVQTATWGYWFTTVTFLIMLTVTVASGVRATQRSSWKQAAP